MTEKERIKNVLMNVTVLATNSYYYIKYRDGRDIALIIEIVNKAIPIKPIVKNNTMLCGMCHEPMDIGFYYYQNSKKRQYTVRTDCHSNYCPNCGQRIDWEKQQ